MSEDVETTPEPTGPSTSTAPGLRLYVGGYTAEMDGTSTGVAAYAVSAEPDQLVTADDLGAVALTSPSFLLAHPGRPLVFAVGEASPGQVSSLRRNDDGTVTLLNTVPSGGDGGCHLALDPSGRYVVVAHYTSGSVASFAVNADGTLSEALGVLEFEGSGPDEDRQDASHAHQVVPVGEILLVPDLGADALHLVRLDEEGVPTLAGDPIRLPEGTGPRHLVVVEGHLVVACELTAELWVKSLSADLSAPGTLVPSSTEEDPESRVYPSGIVAVDGHVVVANRGADTLAVFKLDADDGSLEQLTEIPAGGAWPRDLTYAAKKLWVCSQSDDLISVFDASDGAWFLRLEAQLPSPSPACALVL